jgi:DNA-binding GntR family transcriptional regulator
MRDRRIGETGVTADAAAHLRDAIRNGHFAPGARIV